MTNKDAFCILGLTGERYYQHIWRCHVITSASSLFVFGTEHTGYSLNRPRSIYQYSSMAPRLSGQT